MHVLQLESQRWEVCECKRGGETTGAKRVLRVTDQLCSSLAAAEARAAEQEEQMQLLQAQAIDRAYEHEQTLASASASSAQELASLRSQLSHASEASRSDIQELEAHAQTQMEQLVEQNEQQLSSLLATRGGISLVFR